MSRSRLTDAQIADGLAGLPDWRRDGAAITRTVKLDGFGEAMDFVNRVAQLAEAENHHPDITVRWNRVTLTLSTHSSGGLTQRDLDLAAGIDALASD
jgi:4a-hydroxytetrahydrobiopterin dehydratase